MSDILAVIRMNLLKLFNCGAEMILIVVILVCVIGYTSGISAVFVVFLYLLIYILLLGCCQPTSSNIFKENCKFD